jgi:hypothetical protein
LPAKLRRVEIEIDVSPEEKQMMGDDWVLIGYPPMSGLLSCSFFVFFFILSIRERSGSDE